MAFNSGKTVNMDGSTDDGSYRYTMPAVVVKHEGSSKMKKSIIVNLNEVSRAVGRPSEHLLKFLGQSLNANSVVETGSKAYVAGHHQASEIQVHILTFIQSYVMCKHCGNPETIGGRKGTDKKPVVFLQCRSCGQRSVLDSTDRFVKFMAMHLPKEAVCRDAQHADRESSATAIAKAAQLADAARMEDKKAKKAKQCCPICKHKTSKGVCSKCGAKLPIACDSSEASGHNAFSASIGRLMKNCTDETVSSELLAEFKAGMNAQDSSAQLGAVVEVVASLVDKECSKNGQKLQPLEVADKARPLVQKWSWLIKHLHTCMGDRHHRDGVNVMISAVIKVVAVTNQSIVFGLLLSLREHIEVITDKDLQLGCSDLLIDSKAKEMFIAWLLKRDDDAAADDDDDDDDEEADSDDDNIVSGEK